MKKYFIIILLLGIVFKGYTQELKWIKSEDSTYKSLSDNGKSIISDGFNNTYLVGCYKINQSVYYSNYALFLIKYNSNGNKIWNKKIDLPGSQSVTNATIAINNTGKLVIAGDKILIKLDTSGNIIWQKNVVDTVKSISFDASDNIYLNGSFQGTVDFDPNSTGTYNLTSTGGTDAFVFKTNTNGDFIWAKNIGGIGNDEANCIKVDIYGNVFFTGSFQSSCDFNPNSGVYNIISNGLSDAFVCCLNTSGNFVWAKKMGGISNDIGTYLNIDLAGNIYLTGSFTNTFKYDTLNNSTLNGMGSIDIFLCKISINGSFLWAKNFGSLGNLKVNCLAFDEKSNVYLGGLYQNQLIVNNNPARGFLSTNNTSFIAKFDSTSNFIGIRKIGGATAKSIVVNLEDNIIVHTGTFQNYNTESNFNISEINNEYILASLIITYKIVITSWAEKIFPSLNWAFNVQGIAPFSSSATSKTNENIYSCFSFSQLTNVDPKPNKTQYGYSNGMKDIIIFNIDSDKNLVWFKTIGGVNDDICKSIILDDSNNIYVTGTFAGNVDFDPSGNVFNLSSVSNTPDIFILKLNSDGNFIWAKSFKGTGSKNIDDIKIDEQGNLVCVGSFSGIVDFDPSFNVFNLNGGLFTCKLSLNGDFIWAKNLIISNTPTVPSKLSIDKNNNIVILGKFSGTVDFDPDSNVNNISTNTSSYFILKLNHLGKFVWVKKLETNSATNPSAVEIDSKNSIIASGSYNNTLKFNNTNDTIISKGGFDFFIIKLDSNGNKIWLKGIGGVGNDESYSLSLDHIDNIFISGSFINEVDFDPNNGVFLLNSKYYNNYYNSIFMLKLNNNGGFVWVNKIGKMNLTIQKNNILSTPSGAILLCGIYTDNNSNYYYPISFNKSPGEYSLSSGSGFYYFCSKYEDSDLDIITQPTDRFANIGSNTSFTVSANKSNLTYQWQQKINNRFVNLTNSAKVNGVNSATLSLIGVDYKNNNNNTFRCIIFDDTNSIASNSAQLFINCNFSIVQNPSVQNIGIGNEAKYTIVCSNSNSTYQWQEKTSSNNFINITDTNQFIGITNDTLIIKAVQTSQNLNRYRCVVSDSVCSATSIDVRLSVICNLNFSVQPKNQSTINDSIAVFKVKVWNKNASYQWQQKTGNSSFTNLKDSLNFSGTSSDSLVINSAKLSQNKSVFQCIVTDNYCNIISDTAVLSVNCATEIISQPTNSNTKLDSNATFTVFASGGSNIYQWQINKGNGFENIADSARFNGIKTPNLIVNNVDFSLNNSSFRCLITNGSCLQTTASVILSVICNFNIISQPDSQNVKSGSPAYFKIKTNGDSLTYQWQTKLGGNFYNISNNTVFSGANTDSLIIFNCNLAQDGSLFRCIISSKNCSVISNLFKLNVNCLNIIVNQPKNRIVPSKSSTFFHVATANTNSINYQWQIKQIGGGFINLNNSNFYNGVNTDTLKLENVNLSLNNQTYRCLVTYFECSNISDEVNLSVYCPKDSNLSNPINLNVSKGADAIFTTKINIPFVSYQWQKNKVNLTDTNKFKGINTDSLVIKKISLNDEGNYRCLFSYGECIDLSQEANLSVTNVGYNVVSSQLLNIYPNPNNGEFTLTFNQNNEPKTIEILDALGKLQATFITNNQTYQAQLNHLAKGIYFVKINTPNAQQMVKLLIE